MAKRKKEKIIDCEKCRFYNKGTKKVCHAPTDYCIQGLEVEDE